MRCRAPRHARFKIRPTAGSFAGAVPVVGAPAPCDSRVERECCCGDRARVVFAPSPRRAPRIRWPRRPAFLIGIAGPSCSASACRRSNPAGRRPDRAVKSAIERAGRCVRPRARGPSRFCSLVGQPLGSVTRRLRPRSCFSLPGHGAPRASSRGAAVAAPFVETWCRRLLRCRSGSALRRLACRSGVRTTGAPNCSRLASSAPRARSEGRFSSTGSRVGYHGARRDA